MRATGLPGGCPFSCWRTPPGEAAGQIVCVARGTSTRQWPEARTDTAQGLTWPRKTGVTGLDPRYWISQGPCPTRFCQSKAFLPRRRSGGQGPSSCQHSTKGKSGTARR